ncbi:MAG: phage repressor protein/antirepressor Ant, partial [Anaerotignum sp.]|nr:phage repressor protein/antirepressor Ant [Anaerotignum sp.]
KDVCEILGLGSPHKVFERLDEDEKGRNLIPTLGGGQEMTVINESGLYNVILRSDKPEAKPFRRWVTSEVLPSIRRHGAYMTPETLEAAILNPDLLIRLCTALKDEQDKNKALQAANSTLAVDNQIMKPKADYFDEIVDRNLLTNFRETAKQLQIKEKEFIRLLLDRKYIYRDKKGKIQPYADKNSGLFEVKEFVNEKTGFSSTQTLITPKGRETFRLLFLKAGA